MLWLFLSFSSPIGPALKPTESERNFNIPLSFPSIWMCVQQESPV